MEKRNNLTVIVNTCDAYSDIWSAFFALYDKNWAEGKAYRILLNTESRSFSYAGLNIVTCNHAKAAWGHRLYNTLKAAKTEYVLLLLEDFFFGNRVNHDYILYCLDIMDKNKNIACINFQKPTYGNNVTSEYRWLDKRKNGDEYTLSCQPTLWRRKKLLKLINKNDSPWQFEIFGSQRTALYPKFEFYILSKEAPNVFGYDWYGLDGCGVHKGKWQRGTPTLFAENGLQMDFSIRGFVGDTLDLGLLPKPKKNFNDYRLLIRNYLKHKTKKWRTKSPR